MIQLICGLSIKAERTSTSSVRRRQSEDGLVSRCHLVTYTFAEQWAKHAVMKDVVVVLVVVVGVGTGMWSKMCLVVIAGNFVENHTANQLST